MVRSCVHRAVLIPFLWCFLVLRSVRRRCRLPAVKGGCGKQKKEARSRLYRYQGVHFFLLWFSRVASLHSLSPTPQAPLHAFVFPIPIDCFVSFCVAYPASLSCPLRLVFIISAPSLSSKAPHYAFFCGITATFVLLSNCIFSIRRRCTKAKQSKNSDGRVHLPPSYQASKQAYTVGQLACAPPVVAPSRTATRHHVPPLLQHPPSSQVSNQRSFTSLKKNRIKETHACGALTTPPPQKSDAVQKARARGMDG